MPRITIYCTTEFVGFHRWPKAPEEVAYLRDLHRHKFHVRVDVPVQMYDREIEFHLLKKRVNAEIEMALKDDTKNWSCEHWAKHLLDRLIQLGVSRVEVSEDGENGAVVEA